MTDSLDLPEGVVLVRIDQPRVRNAINSETAAPLQAAFVAFDDDPSAKVAVLTGDEAAFCAGANLRDLPKLRASGPLGPTRLQLSKPVIAAIEGWCVAGGGELAAWCDLRVADETALRYLPPSEEIAGSVLFFASPLSDPVTGQSLGVDGGHFIA